MKLLFCVVGEMLNFNVFFSLFVLSRRHVRSVAGGQLHSRRERGARKSKIIIPKTIPRANVSLTKCCPESASS